MQIEIWLAYDMTEMRMVIESKVRWRDGSTLLEDPANAVPHHSPEELAANAAHVPYRRGFRPSFLGIPVAGVRCV